MTKASSLISMRIIMQAGKGIISGQGYYTVRTCAQIEFIMRSKGAVLHFYPDCAAYFAGQLDKVVAVAADMEGNGATAASALGIIGVMGCWLALFIHAVAIEIYVSL